jgi:hypothetical protein
MGNPPDALLRLVDRFDQDREVFVSADYKEEQLRAEFLNPFFSALGWDMDNKQGLSEFSVMPADVLGQVYEQFLGGVIRLTAGHQAKVEDKPEVRKASGVYYTPTYIVDYFVKNTIGKPSEDGPPARLTNVRRFLRYSLCRHKAARP